MNVHEIVIERLAGPVRESEVHRLAELLVDTVASGAAVSFLSPLPIEQAVTWWRGVIRTGDTGAIILVARDAPGGKIVGSVQMHPAWAPNQPHRGEIAKLLVDREYWRSGLGTRLMRAAEGAARDAGLRLLTLDAREGGAADALYRKMGWTAVGTIPHYALDPDGRAFHGTTIFYKEIAGTPRT